LLNSPQPSSRLSLSPQKFTKNHKRPTNLKNLKNPSKSHGDVFCECH
jgi:hypothetical protein